MPTYEFACKQGHSFTIRESAANLPSWKRCPQCGKRAVQRFAGKTFAFTNTPTASGRRRRG